MERPQNKYIVKYQFKPKYTQQDIGIIHQMLDEKRDIEDIFAVIKKQHRECDFRTVYSWIENCALGKIRLDNA